MWYSRIIQEGIFKKRLQKYGRSLNQHLFYNISYSGELALKRMNKSWCVQWTHHQSQGSEEGGCLHASSSSNHVLYTICTSTHVYKYARSKHTIITYKCICMKGNTERLGEEPINKSRKQTLVLSFSLTFSRLGRLVFGPVESDGDKLFTCLSSFLQTPARWNIGKDIAKVWKFYWTKGLLSWAGRWSSTTILCVAFRLRTCFVLNWPIKSRKLHHAWSF